MKKMILSGKKIEWIVLVLFVVGFVIISIFHEPWFDEAQAWQIAKCASLKEILFEIPHLEGHPPLWHLILLIPAKLGVPFEIGLKSVGLIISTCTAALMLFFSKLPRPVRIALPFTYFFFYQYGVVVRPYGLMLVILLLLGMNLEKRREHPWRLLILLAILCLTSAYGILFAGGIAICLVWDLLKEKKASGFVKNLFRDPQSLSLVVLLIIAVLLIVEIWPSPESYGTNIQGDTSLPLRLFCAFFTFPVECFLSTSSWFGIEQISMQAMSIPITELLITSVLGLLLWLVIICASSKKTLKYLLVPYVLYVFFAAAIYFSTHHMGIVFLLILFWAEYLSRREDRFEFGKQIIRKIAHTDKDKKLFKIAGLIIGFACILIPLYWCASASVHEIEGDYSFSRGVANFIKENELDKLQILCMWNDEGSIYPQSNGHEDYINTYVISAAVPIHAYFDRNIIMNLNDGADNEAYIHHKIISYEDSRAEVEKWKEKGIPDLIFGFPDIESVYGDTISSKDYSCIYKKQQGFIWKDKMNKGYAVLYLRNDLVDKYQFEIYDDEAMRYWNEGFVITDEMRKQYEEGVPIEDILKPYLDAMFGTEE